MKKKRSTFTEVRKRSSVKNFARLSFQTHVIFIKETMARENFAYALFRISKSF